MCRDLLWHIPSQRITHRANLSSDFCLVETRQFCRHPARYGSQKRQVVV
jgi:hypothetical protein